MSTRITVMVATLLIAACSSEPVATSMAETTVSTVGTTTIATTTTTIADSTTTVVETTTTTMILRDFEGPPLLVATESGIHLVGVGETTTLLDLPASLAADDLMGGVVFQGPGSESGFFGTPEETIVRWLPAGTDEPQDLLVPSGEQWLRLVGVELVDGSPTVVYIRMDDRGDFDNARDTLRLYDFETGNVSEVRTVGGWESGAGHITFGGGIFASNWFGEAYSGFNYFDADGNDVTVAGDPYGDAICFDGTIEPGTEDSGAAAGGRCFENVAIAPDGSRLAYTTLYSDDEGIVQSLDLVVVGASDGAELYRAPIRTEAPYSISSLDIRGDLVLYNELTFTARREPLPATVVDLSTGQSATIPFPGTARFAPTLSGG